MLKHCHLVLLITELFFVFLFEFPSSVFPQLNMPSFKMLFCKRRHSSRGRERDLCMNYTLPEFLNNDPWHSNSRFRWHPARHLMFTKMLQNKQGKPWGNWAPGMPVLALPGIAFACCPSAGQPPSLRRQNRLICLLRFWHPAEGPGAETVDLEVTMPEMFVFLSLNLRKFLILVRNENFLR